MKVIGKIHGSCGYPQRALGGGRMFSLESATATPSDPLQVPAATVKRECVGSDRASQFCSRNGSAPPMLPAPQPWDWPEPRRRTPPGLPPSPGLPLDAPPAVPSEPERPTWTCSETGDGCLTRCLRNDYAHLSVVPLQKPRRTHVDGALS